MLSSCTCDGIICFCCYTERLSVTMSAKSQYKPSFYNHLFSRRGKEYIWNTFSGALIEVDRLGLQFLQRVQVGETKSGDDALLQCALGNGLVVRAEINETQKVIGGNFNRIINGNPSSLTFVIAPGLGCNYSCKYCFEAGVLSHQKMTQEVANKTAEFIDGQLFARQLIKQCSISWFGGEPLLYIDVIDKISRRVIACCEKRGIKFRASMITNGRFLCGDIIERLKSCRVSRIQVTVDGTEQRYCDAKGATRNDFYAVIQNIVLAAKDFRISVRINADHNDYEDAFMLTKQLLNDAKLDGRIRVYLAFVRQYTNSYEEDQKEQASFDSVWSRYADSVWSRYAEWVDGSYSAKSFAMPLPTSCRYANCGLICRGNACIGPSGELYRCEHDIGKSQATIGNIETGIAETGWYLDFEQPLPEKCAKCQMLPVCFGGCRNDLVHSPYRVNCASFTTKMETAMLLKYKRARKLNPHLKTYE